jgi:hypothetical protein
MHLKGPLVLSLSVLLAGAVFAMPAHADTIAWANWTTGTAGNPGSASGTLAGGLTVTYAGQTSGLTTAPIWTPTSTFSGGPVGNTPPSTASIALEGTPAGAVPIMETISFSAPVVDPVFAIWSLGQTGITASFDFLSKSPEPITLISGGPSTQFGGSSITVNGQTVSGTEGNGVIQLNGTFTTIDFTTELRELLRLHCRLRSDPDTVSPRAGNPVAVWPRTGSDSDRPQIVHAPPPLLTSSNTKPETGMPHRPPFRKDGAFARYKSGAIK